MQLSPLTYKVGPNLAWRFSLVPPLAHATVFSAVCLAARAAAAQPGAEGSAGQGAAGGVLQEKLQGTWAATVMSACRGLCCVMHVAPHTLLLHWSGCLRCGCSNTQMCRQPLATATAVAQLPTSLAARVCGVQDYFEFEGGNARAGSARGISSETQAAINRWLETNQ